MTLPAPSPWKHVYGKKAKVNRPVLCLRNKGISELKQIHLRAAHASLMGPAAPSSLQLWHQEHTQCWRQLGVPGTGLGGRSWQNKDLCPAQSSYHMLAPALLRSPVSPLLTLLPSPCCDSDVGLSD